MRLAETAKSSSWASRSVQRAERRMKRSVSWARNRTGRQVEGPFAEIMIIVMTTVASAAERRLELLAAFPGIGAKRRFSLPLHHVIVVIIVVICAFRANECRRWIPVKTDRAKKGLMRGDSWEKRPPSRRDRNLTKLVYHHDILSAREQRANVNFCASLCSVGRLKSTLVCPVVHNGDHPAQKLFCCTEGREALLTPISLKLY